MKADFSLCKFNESDLEKKESNHCKVTVEKKQYWDLKCHTQDPIFPHIYRLNIFNAETGLNFELKKQLLQHSQATSDED